MQFTAEFNELLKSAYKFAEVIIKVKVIRYDTMRHFSGEMGKFTSTSVKFPKEFVYQKLLKSVYF